MKKQLVPAILLCILTQCALLAQPLRKQPTILSYNGLTDYGRRNCDSVKAALGRLGITDYDTLDRNQYGSSAIDYAPWCVLIWSSGDPSVAHLPGDPRGQAGLSTKEIGEVEQFLNSGKTTEKKSLIIAGQNIGYVHGALKLNGSDVDSEFLEGYLHTKYLADAPVADTNTYDGTITSRLLDYNSFPDNILSASPDVVKPAKITPTVGYEVNWWAYSYNIHPETKADSGAGTTYRNALVNVTFYSFDWADPVQTSPGETGLLTSGVTRILRGAIDFVASHGWTGCPKLSVDEPTPHSRFDLSLRNSDPMNNAQAEIQFTLPIPVNVTLRLVDVTGKIVRSELEHEQFFPGEFTRVIDLSNYSNGTYFLQLDGIDEQGRTVTIWKKIVVKR